MKPNFLNLSIILVVLIIVGAACSTFTKGKAAGEKAVEKFHAQLNAEKYDEIYEQSAQALKDASGKEDLIKLFTAIRKKLGTAGKASEKGWHVNTTPTGTIVTMSYETEFTNDKATETYTFLMNGEEAQLRSYHINSMKLITE